MLQAPSHPLDSVRFGPGALEAAILRRRCVHSARTDDHATGETELRLVGYYTVWCGMGNSHIVPMHGDWVEQQVIDEDLHDMLEGEGIVDEDRAYWLIEANLIDWSDPCADWSDPAESDA
jgi:hypothetical protein